MDTTFLYLPRIYLQFQIVVTHTAQLNRLKFIYFVSLNLFLQTLKYIVLTKRKKKIKYFWRRSKTCHSLGPKSEERLDQTQILSVLKIGQLPQS